MGFSFGSRRVFDINIPQACYGISGTLTDAGGGTSVRSTKFSTQGVWRVLVMIAITGVTSNPAPSIRLVGYSAVNGNDFFGAGPLTAEHVKQYGALASAPGRECFWFDTFAPWHAVEVKVASGAGHKIRIGGAASNRPWVVLQRTPSGESS